MVDIIQKPVEDLKDLIPLESEFTDKAMAGEVGVVTLYNQVKRGDILDNVIDTETTGLNKRIVDPSILGAALINPFNREIVKAYEQKVAIPEDSVYSAAASLVIERPPEDWSNGMRPDLAVAEFSNLIKNGTSHMADYYRDFHKRIESYNLSAGFKKDAIPLPPTVTEEKTKTVNGVEETTYTTKPKPLRYKYSVNRLTKKERQQNRAPKQIRVERNPIYIPTKDANGKISYNWAISDNGKYWYYRDGKEWARTEAKATTMMHNSRADNNWLWSWFLKYMMPDLFITHTKRHRAFQVDSMPFAREMIQLGPQGREGLKPGKRFDPKYGDVDSVSKGKLIEANTRLKNTRLHIREGITLLDGSHRDERLEHVSPLFDSVEEYAITDYARIIAPELWDFKKYLSDHEILAEYLMTGEGSDDPRMVTFQRYTYPDLSVHIGTTITVDKSYGDMKRAVIIALDKLSFDANDPYAVLLPDGRNIFKLTDDEWQDLFMRADEDPHSILELPRLNKSPSIYSFDIGYRRGAGHGKSADDLQRLSMIIHANKALKDRIARAYGKSAKPFSELKQVPDPVWEEYIFTLVGDPRFPVIHRNDRSRDSMQRHVFEALRSKIDFYRKRNEFIKIMFGSEALYMLETGGPDAYKTYEALVKSTMKKYYRHIAGRNFHGDNNEPNFKIPVNKEFRDNKDAIEFLWKNRVRAVTEGWFFDADPDHYRLTDKNTGLEIAWEELATIDPEVFFHKMKPTNKDGWDVTYHNLGFSEQLMARLFFVAGQQHMLIDKDPAWATWWQARLARIHNGSPMTDADMQRAPTNEGELKFVERCKRNALNENDIKAFNADPDISAGIYDSFVAALPGREAHLNALEKYYRANLEKYQWTPELLVYAGYDPLTKMPLEPIPHVMRESHFRNASKLASFDAMVDLSMRDERYGEKLYILPNPENHGEEWLKGKLTAESNLVFRGEKTGKTYLMPVTGFALLKDLDKDTSHDTIYHKARQVMAHSGYNPDDLKSAFVIAAEYAHPLAGTRVIEPHFDVAVIGQHRFEALVAPDLAGYRNNRMKFTQKLTGLAVPDYGYSDHYRHYLKKDGPIRLRETDDATGAITGWEVETTLTESKTITLREFEDDYANGKITDALARSYGFGGREHMYGELSGWFTRLQKPKESEDNKILLIRFKPVDRKSMAFFKPTETPRAAVLQGYLASKKAAQTRAGAYKIKAA